MERTPYGQVPLVRAPNCPHSNHGRGDTPRVIRKPSGEIESVWIPLAHFDEALHVVEQWCQRKRLEVLNGPAKGAA